MDKLRVYENILREVYRCTRLYEEGRLHVVNYHDELKMLNKRIADALLSP